VYLVQGCSQNKETGFCFVVVGVTPKLSCGDVICERSGAILLKMVNLFQTLTSEE